MLAGAVLEALGDVDGATVLDLYAGAGLFTLPLADAVGTSGEVVSVEGDERAVRDARRNVHDRPHVELHVGEVARVLSGAVDADSDVVHADAVVLDPPRVGRRPQGRRGDRRPAARARRLRRVRPGRARPRRRLPRRGRATA